MSHSKSEQKTSILTVSNVTSALKNIAGLALAVPARVLDSVLLNPLYAGFYAQGLNDISAMQTFNHMSKQKSVVNNGYTFLVGFVQAVIQLPALIVGFLASLLPRAIDKFSSSKPAEQAATNKHGMSSASEDGNSKHDSIELDELSNGKSAGQAALTSRTIVGDEEEVQSNEISVKGDKGPLAQPNSLYSLFADKFGPNAIVDAINKVSPVN